MNALAVATPSAWSLRLLPDAWLGCPMETAVVTAALVAGAWLAGRLAPRGAGWFLLGAVLAAAGAWFLQDALRLLGDSRIWVHASAVYGADAPGYRAPLTARVLGSLGALAPTAPAVPLTAWSVVMGVATAGVLAGGFRDRPGWTPFWAVAWVFLQPMSWIFWGHIETYSTLALVLAALLVALRADFARGRPGPASAVLLAVLCFTHLLGGLVIAPLVAVLGSRSIRSALMRWVGLLALVAVAAVAVPALRAHTLLGTGWSMREWATYLLDILGGWILVLVPVVWLHPFRFDRPAQDRFGFFLQLAGFTFLLLPLGAVFELGVYRDLDLFAPAFVCWTVWAIHRGLATEARTAWRIGLPAGAVFLAALITVNRCPAGFEVYERQLENQAMTVSARAYGYEVLAYARSEEGDPAGALTAMSTAIEVTPGNHRLYGPLGEMQLAAGDTTAAIASLERALSTPRAARTRPFLAELLTRTGRPGDAVALLESHREESLADDRAAAALAVAYFRLGRPDSTLAVADARLRRAEDPVAHANRASALVRLGDYDAAETAMRAAIAGDPDNTGYHVRLLTLFRRHPDGERRIREHLAALPPAVRRAVMEGP